MCLGAGPAQPGAVLGDICDLDIMGLCCNAKSEETLSKDLKRKGLKTKMSPWCRISFLVHSKQICLQPAVAWANQIVTLLSQMPNSAHCREAFFSIA